MNAAKTVVIETLAAFLMIDSMPPKLMVVIPSMRLKGKQELFRAYLLT